MASLGSEEQKMKYLPSLSRLDTIACFGATEPNSGSDIGSMMSTTATQVEGGWLLSGQKRWIGNNTFADILLIFARNTTTNQINGFIVKKGAQGLKATKIENKVGFQILHNGDILLQNVFVPDEDQLPFFNYFLDFVEVIGK